MTGRMRQSIGPAETGCSDAGPRWYVVQAHPNGERKAIQNLERQQFEAYLPRYAKRRKSQRRLEIVAAPLFPRYLFVAVDLAAQRWLSIRSTIGVSRLVCNGDVPVAVPRGLVESLKARQDADGLVRLDTLAHGLQVGDKVRVLGGAFEDNLGLFENIKDDERVTILLDLLGRKVRVTMDIDMIAAA